MHYTRYTRLIHCRPCCNVHINKRQVRWQLKGVSYIVSKRHELWSTNGFELEASFHPPFVNSAFYFIARLRRRRSANETQSNLAKRWTVGRAHNLSYKICGRLFRKNCGQKTLHLLRFSTTLRLNGEYLQNETDRQSGKGAGKYEGSPTLSQNFMTLIHKRLNIGTEFLPTLTISFCPSPSHTLYAALTWRPTVTLNETALGSSAAQI